MSEEREWVDLFTLGVRPSKISNGEDALLEGICAKSENEFALIYTHIDGGCFMKTIHPHLTGKNYE